MTHQLQEARINIRDGIGHVRFDPSAGMSLAIPMRFAGSQPNIYGVDYAEERAVSTETFTGDVSRGGSCNVSRISIIPHCNGTHTECVGHITRDRIAVSDVVVPGLIPACVVSLTPVSGDSTDDTSTPPIASSDRVIDAGIIERALDSLPSGFLQALIVRTLPNDDTKVERHYSDNSAPFFSREAMRRIVDAGVVHLLVDLPSVDRLVDDGAMAAHRTFWGVEESTGNPETSSSVKTITELIYVPDTVFDGPCLLDLQIPELVTDAVPSRPVVFPVQPDA
ncbi:MAG: cyclase family protein [Rhodothermales bacterium]|nr:cyclase family protein [Rhodothermales bacterium]